MLDSDINGKLFDVIRDMYSKAKSCVGHNDNTSIFFPCLIGVRQGENLSPFLFAIFLNDLKKYFGDNNCDGLPFLESLSEEAYDNLGTMLKLYILLYADDTVILCDTRDQMQHALNVLHTYCKTWRLEVNISKTKVLVFCKRKFNKTRMVFTFGDVNLEMIDEYVYLGILFSHNGRFHKAINRMCGQAEKAMYALIRKIRRLNLPVDLQFQMFDAMVKPILLYGCEAWGTEKLDIIERLHLKFIKLCLKLRKSTPNVMVYGESGRHPLSLDVKHRMVSFWAKLVTGNESKLSSVIYSLAYKLYSNDQIKIPWLVDVHNTLNNCGFSNIWDVQAVPSQRWCNLAVKQRLLDQFIQQWNASVSNSDKCIIYRMYKDRLSLETYVLQLPSSLWIKLCQFRTCNHRLPIEKGRYDNIPREQRKCLLCNLNEIGDEFHYLFKCPFFDVHRKQFIPKQCYTRPNAVKFKEFMADNNVKQQRNTAKFVKIIMSKF